MSTLDLPVSVETIARLLVAEPPVLLEVFEEIAFAEADGFCTQLSGAVLGTENEKKVPDLLRRMADAIDAGLVDVEAPRDLWF